MGISERRETEKAAMKQKIMAAAAAIIEQEGYEKLSIRKIAAKIEYSPTTLYLYYKEKAEIIEDMCASLYQKATNAAGAAADENLPAQLQIQRVLCAFIHALCKEPEMAKAVMYSGTSRVFANNCADGRPENSGLAMLDGLINRGIAEKNLRPGCQHAAWMLVSASLGFLMTAIENRLYAQEHFAHDVDDFAELLVAGMGR